MGKVDRLTLIAMAVIAYALANVAHEAVGHGGMCVAVGGKPIALNAVYFDCDEDGLTAAASKWIAAGGTLVDLLLAALSFAALRVLPRRPTTARYAAWLFFSVNAMQAAGYWLFSGVGNLGDWAKVVEGLGTSGRVGLGVLGGLAYLVVIRLSLAELLLFAGPSEGRVGRARALTLLPYLVGGALYCAAGALNPESPMLVLVSAGAASFGGTSAFAWMYNLLHGKRWSETTEPPFALARSVPWIAFAAVLASVFIFVLGRTVYLRPP